MRRSPDIRETRPQVLQSTMQEPVAQPEIPAVALPSGTDPFDSGAEPYDSGPPAQNGGENDGKALPGPVGLSFRICNVLPEGAEQERIPLFRHPVCGYAFPTDRYRPGSIRRRRIRSGRGLTGSPQFATFVP